VKRCGEWSRPGECYEGDEGRPSVKGKRAYNTHTDRDKVKCFAIRHSTPRHRLSQELRRRSPAQYAAVRLVSGTDLSRFMPPFEL